MNNLYSFCISPTCRRAYSRGEGVGNYGTEIYLGKILLTKATQVVTRTTNESVERARLVPTSSLTLATLGIPRFSLAMKASPSQLSHCIYSLKIIKFAFYIRRCSPKKVLFLVKSNNCSWFTSSQEVAVIIQDNLYSWLTNCLFWSTYWNYLKLTPSPRYLCNHYKNILRV